MVRRAFLAAGITVVLALSASGCQNPFTPATPEPPSGTAVVENFSTPGKLLTTMAAAIMKGSPGRNAYVNALADSTLNTTLPGFYAIPYGAVGDAWRITTSRTLPDPWNLPLEKLFFDYLTSAQVSLGFSYTYAWEYDDTAPDSLLDEVAGTALYHRHYNLQASSEDGLIIKTIATGYADLYMVKRNSRWYLTRWEDRVGAGQSIADPEQRSMGWRRLDSTSR
jgi:hypothetical protein